MLRSLGPWLAAAWLVGSLSAVTAGTTVPATRSGQVSNAVAATQLRPSDCASVAVTTRLLGTGTFSGTNAAELILAGTGIDNVSASGGNDCIVGGAGNDVLGGGSGTDVCIGGPGVDTFSSCETQIQ